MMSPLSCIFYFKREKGVSLIELLFVLAVATLIIVFAVGRYQQSQWEHKVAVTQRNVQVLLQSLNDYFYRWCNDPTYQAKYDATLLPEQLVPGKPELIANPLGFEFTARIVSLKPAVLNQPLYQLELSAMYPSEAIAKSLEQLLGAQLVIGAVPFPKLVWTRLPTLSTADSSSVFWAQNEAFNRLAIDGLRAYSTDNPGKIEIQVCDNRKFQ